MSDPDEEIPPLREMLLREEVWRSPLVGIALAFTGGILLDRFKPVPFEFSLLGGAIALIAYPIYQIGGQSRQALVALALAIIAAGAAHHHYQHLAGEDDVGHLAGVGPVPIRFLGVLDEEPRRILGDSEGDAPRTPSAMLRSQPRTGSATTIVSVRAVFEGGRSRPASGRVRLVVSGASSDPGGLLANMHAGDELDIRGQLIDIAPPANPGEFDTRLYWADRGVHAFVRAKHGHHAITRTRTGWHFSFAGWMGKTREAGHRLLDEQLGDQPGPRGLARALLLGEGAPLTADDWSKYIRTGVIHVLAISGQHLVIVGAFLWGMARLLGVRRRRAAIFVTAVLIGYAVLTGGRPPAMRAAVGAGVVCGGLLLRREVLQPNLLAAAWLVVVILQPSDAFDAGTQLSFFSVVILAWCTGMLTRHGILIACTGMLIRRPRMDKELELLLESSRSPLDRLVRWLVGSILEAYAVCAIVWIAITPLVACHSGLIAPMGLLLGPPLGILTTIALLFGFVLLLVGGWAGPLAVPLAKVVAWCLLGCERLVDLADSASWHVHVGVFPAWLAGLFCVGMVAFFAVPTFRFSRRWLLPSALGWMALVLLTLPGIRPAGELRCTFLAVGHGSCVVMQLPDARVILHDAGSLRGPDVASRIIAPYLWSQGIRRIDDVILSHADLDHFNGLAGLLDRFPVGRVLLSESFARKDNRPVRATLELCRRFRVPLITLKRGDRLDGSEVTLTVVHPPAGFGGANENARSVVIEVSHAENTLLLTGDLEGEGLAEVLRQSSRPAAVMQAPHHGSHRLDVRPLLEWASPALVVSGQGPSRRVGGGLTPYEDRGVGFWTTHDHGAVVVTSRRGELSARTFLTGLRRDLFDEKAAAR